MQLAQQRAVPADLLRERRAAGAELEGQAADRPDVAEELEGSDPVEVFRRDPEVFLEVLRVGRDHLEQRLHEHLVAVVCELDPAVGVDQNVRRLDVAGHLQLLGFDLSFVVQIPEPFEHLFEYLRRSLLADSAEVFSSFEGGRLQVLCRDAERW